MADIELVIKIPEDTVNKIKDNIMFAAIPSEILWDVTSAIVNSTPLPKGHGRLKDVDKIISDGISKGFCDWYDEMKYADTIIEADDKNKAKSATSYDSNEEDREV